jgi:hypothetical protein
LAQPWLFRIYKKGEPWPFKNYKKEKLCRAQTVKFDFVFVVAVRVSSCQRKSVAVAVQKLF